MSPVERMRECTCVSTDCSHTTCRAGMSLCAFGSTVSYRWRQLEDVCTAVTRVQASACDVVPIRFIKNTDLTEQTHSGWMSLTSGHLHTPSMTIELCFSCRELL